MELLVSRRIGAVQDMIELPDFEVTVTVGPFISRMPSSKIQSLLEFQSVFAKSDTPSEIAAPPKLQTKAAPKAISPDVQTADSIPLPSKSNITDEEDMSFAALSRRFVTEHERKKWKITDLHTASKPVFMNLKFKLEKVELIVSDDSDAENPEVLVKVVIQNLYSHLKQRNFDTTVNMSLEKFHVVDSFLSTGDAPQYLLASRSPPKDLSVPDDRGEKKFMTLHVSSFQPLSEHYEKAAADVVCDCEFGSMSFVFQPKTVARMMRFMATTFPKNAKTATDVTHANKELQIRTQEEKVTSTSPGDSSLAQNNPYYLQHQSMLLDLTASGFSFELHNPADEHLVAKATMSNVEMHAVQSQSMASVQVSSSLTAEDFTADTATQRKILSFESESGTVPLTIKLKTFDPKARTYPGYDLAVDAMIMNFHVFAREDFMRLCQKCVAPVVDDMNAREQNTAVRDQDLHEATETAAATVSSLPFIRLRLQNLHLDALLANQDSVGAQLSSMTISNGNTTASTTKKNATKNELVTTSQTKSALETIAINAFDLVCPICLWC